MQARKILPLRRLPADATPLDCVPLVYELPAPAGTKSQVRDDDRKAVSAWVNQFANQEAGFDFTGSDESNG